MTELQAINPDLLTKAEFQRLADVPPEAEWFALWRKDRHRR